MINFISTVCNVRYTVVPIEINVLISTFRYRRNPCLLNFLFENNIERKRLLEIL